jgi:DNA-directed RNA polymerase subunit RPC12/RpoP
MADYKCGKCGRLIPQKALTETKIKCPHCEYRILFKVRQQVVHAVKAR